jgi:hypothetical protein
MWRGGDEYEQQERQRYALAQRPERVAREERRMSITRRIGIVVSAVALVVAAGAGTASARPSADSNFSFCNTTGGKIACFTAHLHFANRYHFTLSNIVVTDTLCDNRSALAYVADQNGVWGRGSLGGVEYTYKNSLGCNHSESFGTENFESTGAGTQFVYIGLFGANRLGHSTVTYSYLHYNPYF